MNLVAKPVSRRTVGKVTKIIRDCLEIDSKEAFPIVKFMELGLYQMDNNFNFEVISVEEMPGEYGRTNPEKSKIQIREDVYNGALQGNPRDLFTMAHELGHYFMHDKTSIEYARGDVPIYRQPEWQANTFAAELLAPSSELKGMNVDEIMSTYNVSRKVATIQSQHAY